MDYFTMSGTAAESAADEDLGSGAVLLLPDFKDATGATRHLAVGAGKDATIYVTNRDSMGKFNPLNDDGIYQEISGAIGGVVSAPAYFNGAVYFGAVGDSVKAFAISNARLATVATSHGTGTFGYPGASPSVSANGTSNGIL
jgi:hypothetical protein